MNSSLLAYDFRRLLPLWLLSFAVLGCLYLLLPGPLRSANTISSSSIVSQWIAGVMFGALVSTRLFSDTAGTQSFVFSRGLPRRAILINRLLLSAMVIWATSALLWILLWLPVRGAVHDVMDFEDAVYYPTISQFEPPVAIHFGLIASAVVLLLFYYQTARAVMNPQSASTPRGLMKLWLAELPVWSLAGLLLVWMPLRIVPRQYYVMSAFAAMVACTVVTFLAFRFVEVDQ